MVHVEVHFKVFNAQASPVLVQETESFCLPLPSLAYGELNGCPLIAGWFTLANSRR